MYLWDLLVHGLVRTAAMGQWPKYYSRTVIGTLAFTNLWRHCIVLHWKQHWIVLHRTMEVYRFYKYDFMATEYLPLYLKLIFSSGNWFSLSLTWLIASCTKLHIHIQLLVPTHKFRYELWGVSSNYKNDWVYVSETFRHKKRSRNAGTSSKEKLNQVCTGISASQGQLLKVSSQCCIVPSIFINCWTVLLNWSLCLSACPVVMLWGTLRWWIP